VAPNDPRVLTDAGPESDGTRWGFRVVAKHDDPLLRLLAVVVVVVPASAGAVGVAVAVAAGVRWFVPCVMRCSLAFPTVIAIGSFVGSAIREPHWLLL